MVASNEFEITLRWQEAYPWLVYFVLGLRLQIHRGSPCMISKDATALMAAPLSATGSYSVPLWLMPDDDLHHNGTCTPPMATQVNLLSQQNLYITWD